MTYKPTQLPTVVPKDAPNNRSVLALNFVADMLSGAKNMKALDRAVRIGELMDTGLFGLNEAGLLVPKSQSSGIDQVFTGRNRILNGSFRIWQRGVVFSANGYSADRWLVQHSGASFSVFPASLPGEGLSSGTAMGIAVTSLGTGINLRQPIENVNTLAGRTNVVSFRARGNFNDMLVSVRAIQSYGTGGSASTNGTTKQIKLDTSMRTYNVRMDLPSVAGKTIGANNFVAIILDLQSTGTYYFSDLQFEEGESATPYEWRPEADDLLLCQRYYEKSYNLIDAPGTSTRNGCVRSGLMGGLFLNVGSVAYKTTKRAVPAITTYAARNGVAGQLSEMNNQGVYVANRTCNPSSIGDQGFNVGGDAYTAGSNGEFHWTADAEL